MRVWRDVKKVRAHENVVAVSKKRGKVRAVYTCSGCKYESNRQYNVLRHEERIHWKRKHRVCCGQDFINKGDYYVHCEEAHPQRRANAITSKTKYKITRETVEFDGYKGVRSSARLKRKMTAYNVRVSERLSKGVRTRRMRKMESTLSMNYSVTYRDIDTEDIPLISFLSDRGLKEYLKTLSTKKLTIEDSKEKEEETNETLKIAISSEQNIEKVVSESKTENICTTTVSGSVDSISVELPTKKLFLHRFMTNILHEVEIPLREQNNNECRSMNFMEKQTKEMAPVFQSRPKNSKRSSKSNKENLSKFTLSLEQKLDIQLDRGITVPSVTQVHRDFLSSIDFDKYKIF